MTKHLTNLESLYLIDNLIPVSDRDRQSIESSLSIGLVLVIDEYNRVFERDNLRYIADVKEILL